LDFRLEISDFNMQFSIEDRLVSYLKSKITSLLLHH